MAARSTIRRTICTDRGGVKRIGRFKVESLQSRREAAAVSLTHGTLKLLGGRGRGVLKALVPKLIDHSKGEKRGRDTRSAAAGLQIEIRSRVCSLDAYIEEELSRLYSPNMGQATTRASERWCEIWLGEDYEEVQATPYASGLTSKEESSW